MRPRNVLTETNNMRKLMGLPLLNEDTGSTAEDVKKKVLNESTIEYENNQWLVIEKEDGEQEDETEEDEEQEDETTVEDEDVVEEQEGLGDGSLGIGSGIDVDGADDIGDGEDGMGESPLDQVVAEGSFAKYNISLGGKVGLLSEQDTDVQTLKRNTEEEKRELDDILEILDYEVEQAENKKSDSKSEIKGLFKKIRGNRKLKKVINRKSNKLNKLQNEIDDLEDTEAFKEKRKKIIRDIFLSLYAGIGAIVVGSSAEDIKNKIKFGREKVNKLFN